MQQHVSVHTDKGCRLTGLQLNHSEPGEHNLKKGLVSLVHGLEPVLAQVRGKSGPGSGAREKFVAPVRAFNIIDH